MIVMQIENTDPGRVLFRKEIVLSFISALSNNTYKFDSSLVLLLNESGSIEVSCLLKCDMRDAVNLMREKELSATGDGKVSIALNELDFLTAKYDMNRNWQSLKGVVAEVRISGEKVAASLNDKENFILLSPSIIANKKVQEKFVPGLVLSWTPINRSDNTCQIGYLYVSGKEVHGSLDDVPRIVEALELSLSLASMTTVVLFGHQKISSDGKLFSVYRSTQTLRYRVGFGIIPPYSAHYRREEMYVFLKDALNTLMDMPTEVFKGIKEAVLHLIEAEYDEFIKAKYLKCYISFIRLLQTFSDQSEREQTQEEKEDINKLIAIINKTDVAMTLKQSTKGFLNSRKYLSEREKIDILLEKFELSDLLPRNVTSKIRGTIIHKGSFPGDSLESKAKVCKMLSFGVCWLLLRILNYSGNFIHSLENDFRTEINTLTGERYIRTYKKGKAK